jgi:hypothetical protein
VRRFSLYKIIKILAGAQPRSCCRSIFQQVEFLPLPCQYILSLMTVIINLQEIFQTNSSINNINTRVKHNLHRPNVKLPCFQRSTFYVGIKIFNCLPTSVTILKERKWKIYSSHKKIPTFTLLLICRWIFVWVKMIYNKVFYHICNNLHYKSVYSYLCIYVLFHTLPSLWRTYRSMEYMYACVYVRISRLKQLQW